MKKSKPGIMLLVAGLMLYAVFGALGADSVIVSVNLSPTELARGGKEMCVRIDARQILKAAGVEGKPDPNAIAVRTFAEAGGPGVLKLCGVFEDIDPMVPSGSRFYVMWRKEAATKGGLRAEIMVRAAGETPRPQPARDSSIQGMNWVLNNSFEMPPTEEMLAGKKMPANWTSYQYKPNTIRITDVAAHSGKYSMQLDNPKSVMVLFGQGWKVPKEFINRGSKLFYRSFEKVVKGSGDGGCMYRIRYFSGKSAYLGGTMATSTGIDASGWKIMQGVTTPPAGTVNMDFQFYITGAAPEQTVCVDDFLLQPEAQMLAAFALRPTMVSAGAEAVHAHCTISPGQGLFIGKNALVSSGKDRSEQAQVLLRQDFTAAQLTGGQIRATLVSANDPQAQALVQADAPLQVKKEQTLALPVKALKPGSYEVRLEIHLSDKSAVEAARGTIKVETDPFADEPPAK